MEPPPKNISPFRGFLDKKVKVEIKKKYLLFMLSTKTITRSRVPTSHHSQFHLFVIWDLVQGMCH
jgi:hypothetical protein